MIRCLNSLTVDSVLLTSGGNVRWDACLYYTKASSCWCAICNKSFSVHHTACNCCMVLIFTPNDHVFTCIIVLEPLCLQHGAAYHVHAVVDEFLAKQQPSCTLPFGFCASVSSRGEGTIKPSPFSLNKLAVLLLGYGRQPAVKWARQLMGVKPVDGGAVFYLGQLREWAVSYIVDVFAAEPTGSLYSVVGGLLRDAGHFSTAEEVCR